MADCIFCAIVAGNAPSWTVYEDADCVAFLDVAAATRGHTLVVPRLHVADVFEMSETTAASLGVATHRVANLLGQRLSPAGLSVMQSNGLVAWQEVWHAHVHLVPRFEGDGLVPPWGSTQRTQEDLRDTHRVLTDSGQVPLPIAGNRPNV